MNDLPVDARQSLEPYERRRPDVVRLACLASLAARVEPQLLRRLRLELLPDADVGTEADFWFSPLIESRGTDYVVLLPDIARLLRERLKVEAEGTHPEPGTKPGSRVVRPRRRLRRGLMHRAIAITREVHRGLAPTLLLEENLNALALGDDPERVRAIDEALRPALRALRGGSANADALAQWALGAFRRFHPLVAQAPNAWALRLAAYAHLGLRRELEATPELSARPEDIAWLLPQSALKERVPIGVELAPHALRFVEPQPGGPAFELPSAVPPAVSISWVREGKRIERLVEAKPGRTVTLGQRSEEVTVRTLAGDEYLVTRAVETSRRKQCLVIMGFGERSDRATGRILDLDQSYRSFIKPAVEDAGLECVRADEISHSGSLDPPVYKLLLEADVVVADLSTSHAGTIYELGVRHALRPYTTLVIAEKGFRGSFDNGQVPIRQYEHLGTDVGAREAQRMRAELGEAVRTMAHAPQTDSPVYLFLDRLRPPSRMPDEGAGASENPPTRPSSAGSQGTPKARRPLCLVIMGFGEKVDYATGRTLDLDQTYRLVIKKAVEEADLECVRADEIPHSGMIDRPPFQLLLDADLVIADLSTSPPQAIYELGVRHALRPQTTLVIAEKEFKSPFYDSNLPIGRYEHMGKGLAREEVERFRSYLRQAIDVALKAPRVDSPVYTFLPDLHPPEMAGPTPRAAEPATPSPADATASEMMEAFQEARAANDWKRAVGWLRKLLELRPADAHLKQQLALATYKNRQPDAETALLEARTILSTLSPDTTNDPETLSLWGSVHKRLWELKPAAGLLDEAIRAYSRAFELKQDHDNGINLAYLLTVRASMAAPPEANTDRASAQQVWRRVIRICEQLLQKGIADSKGQPDRAARFWVMATLAEAFMGVGEIERAEALKAQAASEAPAPWMLEALHVQLEKFRQLLQRATLSP